MTLQSHNVATLKDVNGHHDIEVEINKNNKIQDFVEFRVKDKKGNWVKSYIKIRELYGLIFMLVGEEEQEAMMPERKTEERIYIRQLKIKLKKDMRKGETIIANYKISVPILIEEGLRGIMEKQIRKASGLFLPKRY